MNHIKRLRESRGITLKQMASAVGVGESSIRSWEHGRREPATYVIIRIAETYGVSTDYLLGLTDKEGR